MFFSLASENVLKDHKGKINQMGKFPFLVFYLLILNKLYMAQPRSLGVLLKTS